MPGPADVKFYEDHGWWVSPQLFSEEEIERALEAARRYWQGERDSELPGEIGRYLNWTRDEADRRLTRADCGASLERPLESLGLPITKVPLTLRKGQVSFHNCRTIHGSGENRSDIPRVCLSPHLQDRGNRYREAFSRGGELVVHNTDRLVRGTDEGSPDYRGRRTTAG